MNLFFPKTARFVLVIIFSLALLLMTACGGDETPEPAIADTPTASLPATATPEPTAPPATPSPAPLPTDTPLPAPTEPPTPETSAEEVEPATCQPPADWQSYQIEAGDTLSYIAGTQDMGWQELAEKNCMDDPNALKIGQEIYVPNASAITAPPPPPPTETPAPAESPDTAETPVAEETPTGEEGTEPPGGEVTPEAPEATPESTEPEATATPDA